jgi:hypothetical protein
MKTLFVLDNGREYTSHCVHFVIADPDEWGSDVEELMLWSLRSQQGGYLGEVRTILTTQSFDLRDESECSSFEEFMGPADFLRWTRDDGQITYTDGGYILGTARAKKLALAWHDISDHRHQDLLAKFEVGIAEGRFGP